MAIEGLLTADLIPGHGQLGTQFFTLAAKPFVVGQQHDGRALGQAVEVFLYRETAVDRLGDRPDQTARIGQLMSRDRLAHAGHGAIEQEGAYRLALLGGITGQIGGDGATHGVAVDQDLAGRHPTLFHQIAEHGAGILIDPLFAGAAIAGTVATQVDRQHVDALLLVMTANSIGLLLGRRA